MQEHRLAPPLMARRRLLLSAGAAGLVAGATGSPRRALAQSRPAVPLNIASAQGTLAFVVSALLKSQGAEAEFGIAGKVVHVADGAKIISALIGGDIDMATLTGFGQVFAAIEKGARIKVIGGGGLLTPTYTMFTSKPDVRTLKDLEGKTVGSGTPGALAHQLTVALLRKRGVDHTKVAFANIGSSVDIFRAVAVGTVDAGVGETVYIDLQDRYKVRALPESNMTLDLADYTFQGTYVSERTIQAKRDALVRAMAAYGKILRLLHTPAGREPFLAARSQLTKTAADAEAEAHWAFLQKYKPFSVNLVLDQARLDYMQRLNVEFGQQRSVLAFDRVADMSIAQDALKLLGGPI